MIRGLFAVDQWRCNSKVFFLSHMHADHIHGLSQDWHRGPLYCSAISATLLLAKFPAFDRSLIHVLPLGTPSLVPLCNSRAQILEVTAFDADHCPGALMFVFRGDFGCILHTGDFRWETGDTCGEKLAKRKMQLSAAIGGSRVDCLYLDNTFCNARFSFPPRHIAAKQVLEIIATHKGYDVIIAVDMLGKEELLFIAEALKTKIWVWPQRLQTMRLLSLPDVFTSDTTATRIRAVPRYSVSLETVRMLNQVQPTIAIVPSGLWCLCKSLNQQSRACKCACYCGSVHASGDGKSQGDNSQLATDIFLVSYSLHSCFSELKEFMEFVKPTSVRGLLRSSYCDINPCHYFHHLCSIEERKISHPVGLRCLRIIQYDGFSNCSDCLVEDFKSHTDVSDPIGSIKCLPAGRKRRRKAASVWSRLALTALRRKRGGGALLSADVNDDTES